MYTAVKKIVFIPREIFFLHCMLIVQLHFLCKFVFNIPSTACIPYVCTVQKRRRHTCLHAEMRDVCSFFQLDIVSEK